jgi:RNA polymerase sigma-70 factor (ECF subfamily)
VQSPGCRGRRFLTPSISSISGSSPVPDQHATPFIRFIIEKGMLEAAIVTAGVSNERSDSFPQVVRTRETQVLRTAYRILGNWADAEDVAQEVFLRLHRHGLRFANDAALGSWIYRVTVNLCIDRARTAKPAAEMPDPASGAISAEAALIREQQKQHLMSALADLPVRERTALVLREIEELSTAEVAAALGTTESTVRSQVMKAMAKLQSILTGRGL